MFSGVDRRDCRALASLRKCGFAVAVLVSVASLFWIGEASGKPKKKSSKPAAEAAPEFAPPALPEDPNLASLRVKALDQLYELDLSIEQLHDLRAVAAGAASTQQRAPGKATDKFVSLLNDFQRALLLRNDGNEIDKLRNQVVDSVDQDTVVIDDSVQLTNKAREKAADAYKGFKANQIAAFLAAHADEVGDPAEMMLNTTDQVREARLAATAPSDPDVSSGDKPTAADIANIIQDAANDVGELVAGLDRDKSTAVAGNVAKWIKSNSNSGFDVNPLKRKNMEESAAKVVGNVHPMRVLNNWFVRQVALMLSNPQLPDAIDAIIAAKQFEAKRAGG